MAILGHVREGLQDTPSFPQHEASNYVGQPEVGVDLKCAVAKMKAHSQKVRLERVGNGRNTRTKNHESHTIYCSQISRCEMLRRWWSWRAQAARSP